ncbi:MAG: signal peptidase I [Phycisphaerales bacterium JB043]
MSDQKKTRKQRREERRAAEKARHAGKPLIVRAWHYWKPVVIVLAILLPSRSILVDWNDVPTGSMIPTIEIGDRILVNKLSYGVRIPFTMIWIAQWGEIEPGEIVTCKSPADGVRLVKRVMGVPGDTIQIVNNVVHINGEPLAREQLDENFLYTEPNGTHRQMQQFIESVGDHDHVVILRTNPAQTTEALGARNFGPVEIPEGQYFLMGDNRDNSKDSRFFGFVHRDKIFGRSRRVLLTSPFTNASQFWHRLWLPIP